MDGHVFEEGFDKRFKSESPDPLIGQEGLELVYALLLPLSLVWYYGL